MKNYACRACSDTGWVSVPDPDGKRRPWAAACLCAKGEKAAQPREIDGRVIRFAQATRAQWAAALDK